MIWVDFSGRTAVRQGSLDRKRPGKPRDRRRSVVTVIESGRREVSGGHIGEWKKDFVEGR